MVRVDDGTRFTASGTVWSADGFIVATSHGVEADDGLKVETHDGQTLDAKLIGRDDELDIALLKVDSKLEALQILPEEDITPGTLVLSVARPGRAGLQATHGIVGSIRQADFGRGHVVHTDAAFYPGFSGGALVDASGKLAGLINLHYGRGRGIVLSSALIEDAVRGIQNGDKRQRGFLGIASQPVEIQETLRKSIPNAPDAGLLVMSVEPGSGADKGGLLVGDVILSINGERLSDPFQLRRTLRRLRSGDSIQVEVLRGGAVQDVGVTLGSKS